MAIPRDQGSGRTQRSPDDPGAWANGDGAPRHADARTDTRSLLSRPPAGLRGALGRWLLFLGLWAVLIGVPSTDLGAPSWFRSVLPDLIAGAIVAAVSAWLSLHLLPPRRGRGAWAARARVVGRFFTQLVRAGVEVAWLAMKPRLALRPGCVEFRSGLEEPLERAAFAGMSSLVPGTLAVDPPEGDPWRIHCLDVNAPVVESLRMDEALFDQARRRTALKRERLS